MNPQLPSIKTPELLAPAGGREQLEYALRFGADAIYLATDRFGLRQRADNFTLDDIPQAVAQAHALGAKVFVTCNAYMNNDDLAHLPDYLVALEQAKVDAVIISDLGTLRMAKRYAPDVAIHVSTQANTSNAEAALMWYELGANRIVCAREMSLKAIAQMRSELPKELELEVFVHGAMCMAISGRCLISDHLTGRSANRGHCTQPCRWGYELLEPTRPTQRFPIEEDGRYTYLMDSKDLCMLEHLDDIVNTGVDSIKIEGRNKKAFYVATVVNAYRRVLDGADPKLMLPELETVSHRPYSTGFYYGSAEQTPDQDIYVQSYDWVAVVSDEEVLEKDRVKVVCRNRFYEDDKLEVLSPHRQVETLVVSDLRREYATGESESVKTANQVMKAYSFATTAKLSAYDILRVKRMDPNQKN